MKLRYPGLLLIALLSGCVQPQVPSPDWPPDEELVPQAITPSGATIGVGSRLQFRASTSPVTWSSSNPAVASVSGSGLVVGKSVGSSLITARNSRGSESTTVKVIKTRVIIEGYGPFGSLEMGVGQSLQLSAKVINDNTKQLAPDQSVRWIIGDNKTDLVSLSATGLLSAKKTGQLNIYALSKPYYPEGDRLSVTIKPGTTPPPPGPPAPPPPGPPAPPPVTGSFPILFVTQVPISGDFAAVTSTFANHTPSMQQTGRGGDLWIRYPDGTLKNLTKIAGFGMEGMQLANSIAVRDPSVHWDGNKALFSMVIGAPTQQYQVKTFQWQMYEITGLGKDQTPAITKVPNQPPYNNISPIYGTDDRIIFTSDRARSGEAHLYPQHDEYESTPVVTGLWSLNPNNGDVKLLNHAPSGNFTPIVDSFGRVIFTQWDHLKRDQQADADKYFGENYGTFDFASEAADAQRLNQRVEVFPEPRVDQEVAGTNLEKHDFNHFFPWMILEDGTEGETLNHLGRQELHSYAPRVFKDDPNLIEFNGTGRANPNTLHNLFQIKEDPLKPGTYYGIDAPEFFTRASGQVVSLQAPPTLNTNQIQVTYITHRDTASYNEDNQAPKPGHSGHYRDPLPLSDGSLIAAHTAETRADKPVSTTNPSRYDFRLKLLKKNASGYFVADAALTGGIEKTISYWDPDTLRSYSGKLWELQPVEVKPRPRPAKLTVPLAPSEQNLFAQAGVDPGKFKTYLEQNNLALAVVRNATTRDKADKLQPYNLKVPGGIQTLGTGGKIYDISHMQFFQADQVRGIGGTANPRAGRRVLARPMHDSKAKLANPASNGPEGSTVVASDGSIAAFVPARRAMSWQLTAPDGTPVVRERYWVTFQPGEIRVCGSCHGVNQQDQAGNTAPTNAPKAMLELLQYWKTKNP